MTKAGLEFCFTASCGALLFTLPAVPQLHIDSPKPTITVGFGLRYNPKLEAQNCRRQAESQFRPASTCHRPVAGEAPRNQQLPRNKGALIIGIGFLYKGPTKGFYKGYYKGTMI